MPKATFIELGIYMKHIYVINEEKVHVCGKKRTNKNKNKKQQQQQQQQQDARTSKTSSFTSEKSMDIPQMSSSDRNTTNDLQNILTKTLFAST